MLQTVNFPFENVNKKRNEVKAILVIQCTKKLAEEIQTPMSDKKSITAESIYCWHAHLFVYKRRKCVLIMNNLTRYNFVMHGLRKEDFKRFNDLVINKILENLLADNMGQMLVDKYLSNLGEINYTPTSDRSIIGQINEMIMVAQYEMERNIDEFGDPEIAEVNRFLNRFVFLKLPKFFSGETMHEALQQL